MWENAVTCLCEFREHYLASVACSFLVNYVQNIWSQETENCRKDVRQDLPFRIETIKSNWTGHTLAHHGLDD